MSAKLWKRRFVNENGWVELRIYVKPVVSCPTCRTISGYRVFYEVNGRSEQFGISLRSKWEEFYDHEPDMDTLAADFESLALRVVSDETPSVLIASLKSRTAAFDFVDKENALVGYAQMGRICETLSVLLRLVNYTADCKEFVEWLVNGG